MNIKTELKNKISKLYNYCFLDLKTKSTFTIKTKTLNALFFGIDFLESLKKLIDEIYFLTEQLKIENNDLNLLNSVILEFEHLKTEILNDEKYFLKNNKNYALDLVNEYNGLISDLNIWKDKNL